MARFKRDRRDAKGGELGAICFSGSLAIANAYGNTFPNERTSLHLNAVADPYAVIYAIAHANSDCNANTNPHADSVSLSNSHANTVTDTYTNSDTNTHSNIFSVALAREQRELRTYKRGAGGGSRSR